MASMKTADGYEPLSVSNNVKKTKGKTIRTMAFSKRKSSWARNHNRTLLKRNVFESVNGNVFESVASDTHAPFKTALLWTDGYFLISRETVAFEWLVYSLVIVRPEWRTIDCSLRRGILTRPIRFSNGSKKGPLGPRTSVHSILFLIPRGASVSASGNNMLRDDEAAANGRCV